MLPHINYVPALRTYDSAENRAIDRDIHDAAHLAALDALVCRWLDQLAPHAYPLGNPKIKWMPGDLVDVLREQLKNIRWEMEQLKGPLVIEDSDYE